MGHLFVSSEVASELFREIKASYSRNSRGQRNHSLAKCPTPMLWRSRKLLELPDPGLSSCDWNPRLPEWPTLMVRSTPHQRSSCQSYKISADDVKRHQLLGVGCAGRGGRFSEISQPVLKHVQLLTPNVTVLCAAEPQRDDEAAARPQPGQSQHSEGTFPTR